MTQGFPSLDPVFEAAFAPAGGGIEGVLLHGIGPLACRWLEGAGLRVPPAVKAEVRTAALSMLLAAPTARRIRELSSGELLVLKGPEVAALYPPAGRRFSDLDLMARDAEGVQAALLAAGFAEVDDEGFEQTGGGHHHLHPLQPPDAGLKVEIHAFPNWPSSADVGPPVDEIFAAAVPSALRIEGVSAPRPDHHALLLACHAWRHGPLERLRDLLDVAVVADQVPRADLDELARRWGVERLWRTTRTAIDALLLGERRGIPLRVWAAHLPAARDRTVLENHLQRWLSPFSAMPPGRAVRETGRRAAQDLRPAPGESWRTKLGRTAAGIAHPSAPSGQRGAPDG